MSTRRMQVFKPACGGGRGLLTSTAMPKAEMGYFIKEGRLRKGTFMVLWNHGASLSRMEISWGAFPAIWTGIFCYSIIGQQVKIARAPFTYVYPIGNAHLYDQGKE
ncbi:hypothetical protein AMTRI_Chr13g121020 [Amborella trichopoda]